MNGYKKDYHLEKRFFLHRDLREMLRWCAEAYSDRIAFITKLKGKALARIPEESRKDAGAAASCVAAPADGAMYVTTTYADLFAQMGWLGSALTARGMAGQKTGVIGENSYRWVLSYVTVACGVGVTVPLDKMLQKEELISCINRADLRCLFYDKKHEGLVREIAESGETNIRLYVLMDPFAGEEMLPALEEGFVTEEALLEEGRALVEAGARDYLDAEIDPDAMSFLLFTSGTTSQSKAVMLSHRNLMSCNFGMNCEELFFPEDINMMILPLHHIYGFSGLLTFLSQGLTNCFCDGLKYIAKNMQEYGVSVIMSVPLLLENMYKKINKAIEKQGAQRKVAVARRLCAAADRVHINLRKRLFRSIIDQMGGRMRFFINGAAALDPEVQKGLNEFGILTVQGYGLTETSPTIASETYRYLRPGSTGKLMPNVEARIDDPDEHGVGELVVRGENVMLGYYNDPEATAEVMEGDWFHTGDLARIDSDGYVFICGRKKNVIVMKNGKNVFPEEIENVLNMLPYVSESMLFTRHKASDLVLWAKVVVDGEYMREHGCSLEELSQRLDQDMEEINRELPAYKMVKHWFLSEQPTIKTTTQKTRRHDEIRQIEEEMASKGLA